MREIKYRGKHTKTGEWVYGYAVKRGSEWFIDYETTDWKSIPPLGKIEYHKVKVNEKTIGEFTGIRKNGIEVYEKDILRVWQEEQYTPNRDSGGGIIDFNQEEGFSQLGVVHFNSCSFSYKTAKTIVGRHEEIHIPIDWLDDFEIVGNTVDNPELLNSK